jgi:hypothetical protein
MTTSTAGTKARGTPRAPANTVYPGQTFRRLQLTAGMRPFAVVAVDTATDRASGWVMVDPHQDGEDPLLKAQGIQAADRKRPCYITVPTDWLK